MRNQEAARYARWAATAAGLVAAVVVLIYAARAIHTRRRRTIPAEVSASVQRQMQTFTYNGMENNRTLFTIRASRATQFKADSAVLLEDVWISIYGREGGRDDNIHTRECSYAQETGAVECKGAVTIDVQGVSAAPGSPAAGSLHITTSNLTFDGQTGEASTPAPVEFSLPQGQGRGVGVSYSTRAATVRVEHAVEFEMAPSPRTDGLPVSLRAGSLEVRRNDHRVVLAGPVFLRQGARQLSAGNISLSLDQAFHARHALAQGHPSVLVSLEGETIEASSDSLEADLSPEGWIERIAAQGRVAGSRRMPQGSSRLSADRVNLAFAPEHNVLREVTARGSVAAQSQKNGASQTLKTPALSLRFAPGKQADPQRVEDAETLGPSTIVLESTAEAIELRSPNFKARFGESNRLAGLAAKAVEFQRTSAHSPSQIGSANRLTATFTPDSQWEQVDETGNVKFQQEDRQAFAQKAKIDRGTGRIILTGSPTISDSATRTTAQTVTLDQKSGQFLAEGGVLSTYLPPPARGRATNGAAGAAHVAALKLTGSTSSGQVVYSGGARLWQGKSMLEARQIELSRDAKEVGASGNVVAVFPQAPGPEVVGASKTKKSGPAYWEVRAERLTYSNVAGKVHFEGGVRVVSGQVSLTSRSLDVELGGGPSSLETNLSPLARGQVSGAVAAGGVVVSQDALRARAERAVYTAADGKFVLSGGEPTVTDASGNSTSGRSLTFVLPDDTILIDSNEGSRTLTKHRVEK